MPGIWKPEEEMTFVAKMQRLGVMFGRTIDDELLEMYREELEDLDGDQVVLGISACVRECKFWPTVRVVRDYAGASNVAEMQQRIESRMDDGRRLDDGEEPRRRVGP